MLQIQITWLRITMKCFKFGKYGHFKRDKTMRNKTRTQSSVQGEKGCFLTMKLQQWFRIMVVLEYKKKHPRKAGKYIRGIFNAVIVMTLVVAGSTVPLISK